MADEQKNKSTGADGFMPWFKETFPYGLAGKDSPLSFLRAKSDEEKTPGMKRGGAVKKYAAGGAVAAVHKHERAMHKGKPLTKLAKGGSASSRADGCATKGKTKGRFV